jgi:hypothetical protein
MTDTSTNPDTPDTDKDLRNLEAADPADAPQIAENLADRLARELDGPAAGSPPSGPQDSS